MNVDFTHGNISYETSQPFVWKSSKNTKKKFEKWDMEHLPCTTIPRIGR